MKERDLNYIRDLLIKGRMNDALQELFALLQSSSSFHGQLRDDVILLQTQYNELKRKENLHLISSEEAQLNHSQLQNAILVVINSLENPSRPSPFVVVPGLPQWPSWVIPVGVVLFLVFLAFLIKDALLQPNPVAESIDNQEPDPAGVQLKSTSAASFPDVYLSDWRFDPPQPTQYQEVELSFLVGNKGDGVAQEVTVAWWPNAHAGGVAKRWTVSLAPHEEKRRFFTYEGYTEPHNQLQTKLVVDPDMELQEVNRSDNTLIKTIQVKRNLRQQPDPTPSEEPVMDISGFWITPFPRLTYEVTQEGADYGWVIPGSGTTGTGKISGNQLSGKIGEQTVTYEAVLFDADGTPLVLFTAHPLHFRTILFKDCNDLQRFLHKYKEQKPNYYTILSAELKKIQNPVCLDLSY